MCCECWDDTPVKVKVVGFLAIFIVTLTSFLIGFSVSVLGPLDYGLRKDNNARSINSDKIYNPGKHFTGLGIGFLKFPKTHQYLIFSDDLYDNNDTGFDEAATFEKTLTARTSEGLYVVVDVFVSYTLTNTDDEETKAYQLYQIYEKFGMRWDSFLQYLIQSVLRDVIMSYDALDLPSQRSVLAANLYDKLESTFNDYFFTLQMCNIINIDFPNDLSEAIMQTQIYSQKNYTYDYIIEKTYVEGNTTVALAELDGEIVYKNYYADGEISYIQYNSQANIIQDQMEHKDLFAKYNLTPYSKVKNSNSKKGEFSNLKLDEKKQNISNQNKTLQPYLLPIIKTKSALDSYSKQTSQKKQKEKNQTTKIDSERGLNNQQQQSKKYPKLMNIAFQNDYSENYRGISQQKPTLAQTLDLYTTKSIDKQKKYCNHFEFNDELTTKSGLLRNLRQYMQKNKDNLKKDLFDVTPISFYLDLNDKNWEQDLQNFLNFYIKYLPRKLDTGKKNIEIKKKQKVINSCQEEQDQNLKKNKLSNIKEEEKNEKKSNYQISQKKSKMEHSDQKKNDDKYRIEKLTKIFNNSDNSYVWLLKTINMNRGRGIEVFQSLEYNDYNPQKTKRKFNDANQNQKPINKNQGKGHVLKENCFVIQKYLERPFCINQRKFDIRVWSLVTQNYDVYVFQEGYLRTSSEKYDLENIENPFIHLTNNAVQKYSKNYGIEEFGNQLSFQQFQDYLDQTINHNENYKKQKDKNFEEIKVEQLKEKMNEQIKISLESVKQKINS
ncbi:hypothetical protein PPERSA_10755 [Pseudocohnilembus persalinus]|uniref:Band 7 domain-containing protein n=1 Tax=Pseudocohnilembus persalinus TaxID=266149 RepID=A0A0V0QDQ8_PSEPJ|nr:hypothetical protein PPERSA_10755 [Pseudocohnilembus persalinus]|eukprot:KRX00256.1 hypothetical protein PPERSA_10755 [Pseudocohnilembus persalinus]